MAKFSKKFTGKNNVINVFAEIDAIDDINRIATHELMDKIGSMIVDRSKELIASGLTPVKGPGIKRRFEKYKESYIKRMGKKRKGQKKASKETKGSNPITNAMRRKRPRPVNLHLTGEMLKAFTHKVFGSGTSAGVRIGFFDEEQAQKAGWNQDLQRFMIPTVDNKQRWVTEIELEIQRLFDKQLKSKLK